MENMERNEPILTGYLPGITVARLSGGMEMDVQTTGERTVMQVETQAKKEELIAAQRSAGIKILNK